MADELPGMTLKAVGTVRSEIKQPAGQDGKEVVSDIVIDSSLTGALDNLDDFSHIIVLYWMHRATNRQLRNKVYPMGRQDVPLVGLFASRSPHRPNPIGVATVRLLQRQGNILRVKGLDAIDGTPVIDIKPYLPGYDSAANTEVPPWITNR